MLWRNRSASYSPKSAFLELLRNFYWRTRLFDAGSKLRCETLCRKPPGCSHPSDGRCCRDNCDGCFYRGRDYENGATFSHHRKKCRQCTCTVSREGDLKTALLSSDWLRVFWLIGLLSSDRLRDFWFTAFIISGVRLWFGFLEWKREMRPQTVPAAGLPQSPTPVRPVLSLLSRETEVWWLTRVSAISR